MWPRNQENQPPPASHLPFDEFEYVIKWKMLFNVKLLIKLLIFLFVEKLKERDIKQNRHSYTHTHKIAQLLSWRAPDPQEKYENIYSFVGAI